MFFFCCCVDVDWVVWITKFRIIVLNVADLIPRNMQAKQAKETIIRRWFLYTLVKPADHMDAHCSVSNIEQTKKSNGNHGKANVEYCRYDIYEIINIRHGASMTVYE